MVRECFTVLGATGFIGSHLHCYLEKQGHNVLTPPRNAPWIFTEPLGHILYCIGLTADFRNRPFDTINAHVCYLAEILSRSHFDSLLYLSSTRVYLNAASGSEDERLIVNPLELDDLYNLSKLTGEALCFRDPRARVVRLSNVIGSGSQSPTALQAIISAIHTNRRVVLHTTLDSEKDYIWLDDVVKMLPVIATNGREKIYNLASGVNLSYYAILQALRTLAEFTIEISPKAQRLNFPQISITKMQRQFDFSATDILPFLPSLMIDKGKINEKLA
ncbi:putative NAD-dependent epimerase/dehydratase [Candidatus Contendobacter odensis Run_B_J11]|uniref:NAD-dependent epimerase/dehydratase n=1 Tax=Candidatus Contendobacter odensis Run_B_J11 TaxID=1400861 RepID=A0A7U7GFH3_9GAMM|nr:putative NAD-dependent epimerase/dehydratase [Candidatus Contendobacter odensis Run_B_J11]